MDGVLGASLLGLAGLVPLGWLLRRRLHRALAPERMPERRSPADLGLAFREVSIPTQNGKSLFGWFISAGEARQAPAVVVLHGWGGNAESMLPLAPPLQEAGFAILLIDARCHGRSDEDSFASMPRFAEDLERALDWLGHQPEVDPRRIALIGHSVGAAAALLAASRRDDIAAVASLAAFAHPEPMMRRWLAAKGIPHRPFGWLILRYVESVIGHRFDDIAPVATIRKLRCPVLLVHGDADATVPVAEARAIHAAARSCEQVELRIVPGGHDDYDDMERELPNLVGFLSEAAARNTS